MRTGRRLRAALITALIGVSAAVVGASVAGVPVAGYSAAPAAYAESPVQLGQSHVVDDAGVLGGQASKVESSLDDLYSSTGIDLFVVYVDTFSNPSNAKQWADTTADMNNLGTDDYLLAIATQGRAYYLSAAADSPLTDAQLGEIEKAAEAPLHSDDWAGAALAASAAFQHAAAGEPVDTGSNNNGNGNGAIPGNNGNNGNNGNTGNTNLRGGGAGFFWFFIIAVIVVGGIVFFVARRRGTQKAVRGPNAANGPKDELAGLSLKELQQRSGSALVATDDAIKGSEQELGFAEAQYGADATKEFQAALTSAKAQLKDAFTLQQKLDDAIPDTEEEQRQWRSEIIRLCEKANAALDAQADNFDQLRDLAKNAPEALERVEATAAQLQPRVTQAESTLVSLAASYSGQSLATVHDNITQAKERLAFSQAARETAKTKLAAEQPGQAAVAIRAAEGAVDQAKLLLDAIDRVKKDLDSSRQSVAAAIADLEGDVAQAKAMAGAGTAGLDGVIASTQQTITDAKGALAASAFDPIALTGRLDTANRQIDGVLQGVRDAQQQAQRMDASLGQTLLKAHAQISAAQDFIASRRGAVGAEARTRLAEAARSAEQAEAMRQTDLAGALQAAQRADALAGQAIQRAQADVGGFQPGAEGVDGWSDLFGGGYGAGYSGRRGSSGGMSGMGGLITGAIIGGLLSGGGGRRRGGFGGFGGMGGGGFGGMGGFGGPGRRGGGGSFGGGGGRRGGGGRF